MKKLIESFAHSVLQSLPQLSTVGDRVHSEAAWNCLSVLVSAFTAFIFHLSFLYTAITELTEVSVAVTR